MPNNCHLANAFVLFGAGWIALIFPEWPLLFVVGYACFLYSSKITLIVLHAKL